MPRPHSRDLRIGRWSEAGQIYLVTTKTHRREPIFEELPAGRILVSALRWADDSGRTRTWAFVVMPDHLHWLLALGEQRSLSDVVSSLKKYSSRKINEHLGRRGTVWQSGFHDHALRKEEDLRAVARYVVMNPVRAGLVRSLRDYSLWDACWLGATRSLRL